MAPPNTRNNKREPKQGNPQANPYVEELNPNDLGPNNDWGKKIEHPNPQIEVSGLSNPGSRGNRARDIPLIEGPALGDT